MASIADSLKTSSINITNISKSLFETKRSVSSVNDSVANISRIISTNTRIKRDVFANTQLIESRRREALKRKEIEDQLESSKVSSSPARGLAFAGRSDKGPLGRLLGFLGFITAGWIVENLPTWIFMGQEFVTRIQIFGRSMYNMIGNMQLIIDSFGSVLKNSFNAIITLDFSAFSEGSVAASFDELNLAVQGLGDEITETFRLFTTPLNESVETGEKAPALDEDRRETMFPSEKTYYSEGGTKIVDVGGKDYGRYIPGGMGSRGSSRVHGAGGQRGHTGEDYSMPIGTPLTMIAKGTVIDVENNIAKGGGYGKFVVIQLDSGEYVKLAHLDSVTVKKGDKVGAGSGPGGTAKVVGFSGDTGLSTGPHLHLDYAKSYDPNSSMVSGTLDPMSFINGGGLVKGKNVKSTGEVKQTRPPTSQPQQTMIPSGGTLSTAQLVALAKQAGMTQNVNVKGYSGPLSVLMGAVGMQESRGKSTSMRSDTEVYGLWQIRWPVHAANLKKIGITSPQQLYDPLLNAKAAKMIYDSQGITAWSGFTDGNYKKFLPEAQKAAGISPAQYSQAKISSPSRSAQPAAMTPQRKGSSIVFIDATQPQQPQTSYPSQQPTVTPTISEFKLLNNFIKNKLLLDLAYL